jgi:hypothetical protein
MGAGQCPRRLKPPRYPAGVSPAEPPGCARGGPCPPCAYAPSRCRPPWLRPSPQARRADGDGRGRGPRRAGTRAGAAAWPEPARPRRRWGQALPPLALTAAPVGRGRERLDAFGPRRLGVARRSGHWATTARRGWGAEQWAEPPARPGQGPDGSSQATRPARPPYGLATLCGERAGPRWGQPEAGQAAPCATWPTRRW